MPELTTRNVTARVKRHGDRLFADHTFRLTLPFTGSRESDNTMASKALTERGYVVNAIISQRGPSLR